MSHNYTIFIFKHLHRINRVNPTFPLNCAGGYSTCHKAGRVSSAGFLDLKSVPALINLKLYMLKR